MNIIIDTKKIQKDIISEFEEINSNFKKILLNINAIQEMQCIELYSVLENIKKDIDNHGKMCNDYIENMGNLVKKFDELSDEILKSASSFERINASNIMSKK